MKKKIERYYYQLIDGCGKENCSNEVCASSPSFKYAGIQANQAAVLSLELLKNKSLLCELQVDKPLKLKKVQISLFSHHIKILNKIYSLLLNLKKINHNNQLSSTIYSKKNEGSSFGLSDLSIETPNGSSVDGSYSKVAPNTPTSSLGHYFYFFNYYFIFLFLTICIWSKLFLLAKFTDKKLNYKVKFF